MGKCGSNIVAYLALSTVPVLVSCLKLVLLRLLVFLQIGGAYLLRLLAQIRPLLRLSKLRAPRLLRRFLKLVVLSYKLRV